MTGAGVGRQTAARRAVITTRALGVLGVLGVYVKGEKNPRRRQWSRRSNDWCRCRATGRQMAVMTARACRVWGTTSH